MKTQEARKPTWVSVAQYFLMVRLLIFTDDSTLASVHAFVSAVYVLLGPWPKTRVERQGSGWEKKTMGLLTLLIKCKWVIFKLFQDTCPHKTCSKCDNNKNRTLNKVCYRGTYQLTPWTISQNQVPIEKSVNWKLHLEVEWRECFNRAGLISEMYCPIISRSTGRQMVWILLVLIISNYMLHK